MANRQLPIADVGCLPWLVAGSRIVPRGTIDFHTLPQIAVARPPRGGVGGSPRAMSLDPAQALRYEVSSRFTAGASGDWQLAIGQKKSGVGVALLLLFGVEAPGLIRGSRALQGPA